MRQAPGASAERSRRLDLGADDVLSLPFDSRELLSRVRSQLRNKQLADQLRAAEGNRSATEQVVAAVNEERRTLRMGGLCRQRQPRRAICLPPRRSTKPSVVIATWAGYKKAGSLLTSTEHRGTADGKPLHIFLSEVSVKLTGSDTRMKAE